MLDPFLPMKPLQHAMPDVLARLVRGAPLSPEKVRFAWRTAVGPAMARASSARLSGEGVIEVECGDDHWRREIRRALPTITRRLAAFLGEELVRKITVPPPSRPRRRA